MKLVIGNKNYSSWSLRAWLLLAANEISFEEVSVSLSTENTSAEIAKYSAAGKVPVVHDRGLVVWDSLAICEYISEQYLLGGGWPKDEKMRAIARSCCAEMHSGFFALRQQMPMNCRATNRKVDITIQLAKEIERIDTLWTLLREKNDISGPYLFGEFTIADCMFAPVIFRFNTYAPQLSEPAQEYMKSMLNHKKMVQWLEAARQERETIECEEIGLTKER